MDEKAIRDSIYIYIDICIYLYIYIYIFVSTSPILYVYRTPMLAGTSRVAARTSGSSVVRSHPTLALGFCVYTHILLVCNFPEASKTVNRL